MSAGIIVLVVILVIVNYAIGRRMNGSNADRHAGPGDNDR